MSVMRCDQCQVNGAQNLQSLDGAQGRDPGAPQDMIQAMLNLLITMLSMLAKMDKEAASSAPPEDEIEGAGGAKPAAGGKSIPSDMGKIQMLFEKLLQEMTAGTFGDGEAAGGDATNGGVGGGRGATSGAPVQVQDAAGPSAAPTHAKDHGATGGVHASQAGEGAGRADGADKAAKPESNPKTTDTPAVEGTQQVGPTAKVGASQTKDGYTVEDVKKDMLAMQANNPTEGPPPTEPKLTQIAQGIVDGINANFSGKNGIGDFSDVSGEEMAKTLTAMAWKESRFDTAGQDAGGVLQCWHGRLDSYNEAHGTNLTQADLQKDVPLAMEVSTWAMANPPGIVGIQAGSVPIPENLADQAAYYWNYNPTSNHGHANELQDYMAELSANRGGLADR